jgi:hypothetical protein
VANDELFIEVLAQIEREPERWDQGNWLKGLSCGTAGCFAGWACMLGSGQGEVTVGMGACDGYYAGKLVPELAAQLLGIEKERLDSGNLFYSENTLDDLYRHSAELTGLDETVLRDKVRDRAQDTA